MPDISYGSPTLNGELQATTTPALPAPSSSQTMVMVTGTGSGGSQNAYTVTTGKTFYLYGGCIQGGSTNMSFYKNDGTTFIWEIRQPAGVTTPAFSGFPTAVYTSAQVVKVTASAAPYSFTGVEQ